MVEVEKLSGEMDPKKIKQKVELNTKIDNLMEDAKRYLDNMKVELKSQKKKKKKFVDVEEKEKIYKLLEERYLMIRDKISGVEPKEEEFEVNKNKMEELEQMLEKRRNNPVPNREIYKEEEDKLNEWKERVNEQDKQLDVIHENVKGIHREAKLAGEKIDDIGKNIGKTTQHVDKTNEKLVHTNEKLKDLIKKIRSGDKCCVTLILLLILFGLIAVVYNIIKKKWF